MNTGARRFLRRGVWSWLRDHATKNPEHDAGMVLATYLREFPSDDPLPIPIEEIVEWMGVLTTEGTDMPQSATLDTTSKTREANDDCPVMTLRSTDHIHHRRFSMGHELGHLMMHDLGVVHDRDLTLPTYMRSSKEREANDFAAHILMPAYLLVPAARRRGIDAGRLSRQFRVSELAMTVRLKTLRLMA